MQDHRIDSIVAAHAAQRADRLAIAFKDTELTYACLEAEVARMAGWLAAVGIGRGAVSPASAEGTTLMPEGALLRPL